MTAATYTSDLTDIYLFESTGGVGAYGGGGAGLGAGPDYAMEGINAVDKQITNAEKGFLFDNVSNFTGDSVVAGDVLSIISDPAEDGGIIGHYRVVGSVTGTKRQWHRYYSTCHANLRPKAMQCCGGTHDQQN